MPVVFLNITSGRSRQTAALVPPIEEVRLTNLVDLLVVIFGGLKAKLD